MDEYNNRTHVNGHTRIHVSNHKIDYKYCSSIITLEKDEELWMESYEQKLHHIAVSKTKADEKKIISNLMVFAI